MTYKITIKNTSGEAINTQEFPTKTKAEMAAKTAVREHQGVVDISNGEGVYLIFKYENNNTIGGYHHTGEFIDTVNG